MKPLLRRPFRPAAVALLLAAVALVACDDDPFGLDDWVPNPDTLLLYSLARPELNLPSVANLYEKFTLLVQSPGSTGSWDIALDTREGGLVFLTPAALGIESRARIAPFPGQSFDDLTEAPADTTEYVADEPVPVALGTSYVVRTSEYTGNFGQRCVFYSKLEPLELDHAAGTVRFVVDTNPICNERALVPPGGN
jgi:hypothetical protein